MRAVAFDEYRGRCSPEQNLPTKLDDTLWAAEIVWFDELYGTSSGSGEEGEAILEEMAVDGVFAVYYDG